MPRIKLPTVQSEYAAAKEGYDLIVYANRTVKQLMFSVTYQDFIKDDIAFRIVQCSNSGNNRFGIARRSIDVEHVRVL